MSGCLDIYTATSNVQTGNTFLAGTSRDCSRPTTVDLHQLHVSHRVCGLPGSANVASAAHVPYFSQVQIHYRQDVSGCRVLDLCVDH
jgi:hypothetical protein